MKPFASPLRSLTDMMEIGDFIGRDDPARAITFVREPRQQCVRFIEFPESAPARPELGEGIRMGQFGRHLIFSIVHDDAIEVMRVVHGARDFDAGDLNG